MGWTSKAQLPRKEVRSRAIGGSPTELCRISNYLMGVSVSKRKTGVRDNSKNQDGVERDSLLVTLKPRCQKLNRNANCSSRIVVPNSRAVIFPLVPLQSMQRPPFCAPSNASTG